MKSDSSRIVSIKPTKYRPGCGPTRLGFAVYKKDREAYAAWLKAVKESVLNGTDMPVREKPTRTKKGKHAIPDDVVF